MGFDDASKVLAKLQERCAQKAFYNLFSTEKDAGDELPSVPAFDVALSDLSSLLFQVFYGANSGQVVLNRLQERINKDTKLHGVCYHVFCVDDRRFVTDAKLRERRLREAKKPDEKILTPTSSLLLSSGAKVDVGRYEFALDAPMPADFQTVACSPRLMRKAIDFILLLLSKHAVIGSSVTQGRIIVSGLHGQDANVLHRVFIDGACAEKTDVCTVGEAEGQCIYWMLKFMPRFRRFLIHSNDSDTVSLALMHTRRFYDAATGALDGSLWLDITAQSKRVRFVDVFTLWRGLKASSLAGGRFIRNDVELVLLVATLAGNDYCLRMPQIGPGELFGHLEDGMLAPAAARKRFPIALNVRTGDMLIDELAVVCFIAHIFLSKKTIKAQALRNGACLDAAKAAWDYSEPDLHRFFDVMAKASDTEFKTKQTRVPYYSMVRAHVRRAFFSVHYYFNIAHPERMLNSNLILHGYSIYGHVDLPSAEAVSVFDGLAEEVLLVCGQDKAPLQPFDTTVCARQLSVVPRQKKSEETLESQRLRQMRKNGPNDLWLDLNMRRSLELQAPFDGEHGTNFPHSDQVKNE